MAKPGNERIHSVYLDELENAAVRKVALANGAAPNAIVRIAVRKLLGLPSLDVAIPAGLLDELGD